MSKLLMITGLGSGIDLASDKKGAFYQMLEEFHKYWDRIDIIIPKIKNQASGEKVILDNVHLHISSWPLILHPFFFVKKGYEIYKKNHFDLMTVQEYPPFYNGIGAKLIHSLTGVPYILEIMHIPGFPRSANFKETIYRWWSRMFLSFDSSSAKAVRVINQTQTRDFLLKSSVPKDKIIYIPAFYIDTEVFKPIDVQKKYDLVYTARLEKNKGILNLVQAVSLLKKSKPDISLLIIGSGPLRGRIEKEVSDLGLGDNIKFSGWLEDSNVVAMAMNTARLFVNPSLNEGGPRVALEAMACGLSVITTRVGVMVDIIKEGENGMFTDWSAKDIAEKISRLLQDDNLGHKFMTAGLETIRQFEKKSAIKNYADKLKSLIQ